MKRTYIKPFMESEEFVTNEYVAACWLVTCETDGESFITCERPSYDANDDDGDGYTFGVFPPGRYYKDSTENPRFTHPGHTTVDTVYYGWAIGQHKVKSELISTNNGPNAS